MLTFDPRGNGHSDRPSEPHAYDETEYAGDALAVMDATDTERAIIVGLSMGAQRGLLLAAEHPDRVAGVCFAGPAAPLAPDALPTRALHMSDFETESGWAKYNRHYWEWDFRGFVEFFMGEIYVEPHSTKQVEDAVGTGHRTRAHNSGAIPWMPVARVDAINEVGVVSSPVKAAHELSRQTGGELVLFEGSGHNPQARDPVRFNLELRDFALGNQPRPSRTWRRGRGRRRRALYDWLAQDPVTRVLEGEGERIHPASADLASEWGHIASESSEHELHCFEALRRMDEILLANFMVFHDLVESEPYA